MEQHDFIVTDIQGDYAFLTQTDTENAEPFQVALALLPPETDIGTKLRGFMGMFEIISRSCEGGYIIFEKLTKRGDKSEH